MSSSSAFAPNFTAARSKFLAAAAEARADLESVAHPELGPDGETLTTDVAWIGPRDASNVLVLISGTHGVEGFCGSGAQIDWLQRGEYRCLKPDTAALLVHAINPWGFAWLRRTTHENIDLNRNWIDFDGEIPRNDRYDQLHTHVVPEHWFGEARERAEAGIKVFIEENGQLALQEAIAAGQYSQPAGIFYGGKEASWSRQTQTNILKNYLGQASNIFIIDYHTGLGPWGYGEPLCTEKSSTAEFGRVRQAYGANVKSISDGKSVSTDIGGDGLSAATRLLPQAKVSPMALEFGTVSVMHVLEALRADAWLHAYGDLSSPDAAPIKKQIRDAFYADDDVWRGMVLGQSLQHCRMALDAMSTS